MKSPERCSTELFYYGISNYRTLAQAPNVLQAVTKALEPTNHHHVGLCMAVNSVDVLRDWCPADLLMLAADAAEACARRDLVDLGADERGFILAKEFRALAAARSVDWTPPPQPVAEPAPTV